MKDFPAPGDKGANGCCGAGQGWAVALPWAPSLHVLVLTTLGLEVGAGQGKGWWFSRLSCSFPSPGLYHAGCCVLVAVSTSEQL